MKAITVTAVGESQRASFPLSERGLVNHLAPTDGMTKHRDALGFALAFALETDEETWQRVCRMYGLRLDRSNCGIVKSRGKEASVKPDEPTYRKTV